MDKTIYLCLAHMSEEGIEQKYVKEAFDTNWVVPLGPNVNAFEEDLKRFVGEGKEVVALSAGTAAVHLALLACVLNFKGVHFTTRSFMDEFYNTIITAKATRKTIRIESMEKDLSTMLEAVSKTQRNSIVRITPLPYTETNSVSDMEKLFASMSI